MPYSLEYHPERVIPYLRNHASLSRQGRIRLFTNLDSDLRLHADFYINDESRRFPTSPNCFRYDIALLDQDGDGKLHRFAFVVNAAAAKYGVLRIEYVEGS